MPLRLSEWISTRAGDLGHDRRVLGLAGLEDLGDSGETTDDVLRALALTRLAGEHVPRLDLLAVFDLESGAGGEVVEVEDVARRVDDVDRGVEVALVLDDREGLLSPAGLFLTHGLAEFDVDELDDAVLLGEDGGPVGVPLDEELPLLDLFAILRVHVGAVGDFVFLEFARLGIEDGDLGVPLEHDEDVVALVVLGGDGVALVEDELAGVGGTVLGLGGGALADTTGVERAHRELGARLADGLGGDDADGEARLDDLARREVHAVVQHGAPGAALAGERRADDDGVDPQRLDLGGGLGGDHLVLGDDPLVGDWVDDGVDADATDDLVAEGNIDLLALVDGALDDAADAPAVVLADDDRLGDVAEFSREVARVGGLEGGVGQTLAGAVSGGEVLEDVEALAEVRADGRLDDRAVGLGHETAHAGGLHDVAHVTSGPRVVHEVDGVQVGRELLVVDGDLGAVLIAAVVLEGLDEGLGHLLAAVGPDVDQLVVSLTVGDDASVEVLLDAIDTLLGVLDEARLFLGNAQIGDAEGEAGERGLLEAHLLEIVEDVDGRGAADEGVAVVDHAGAALFAQGAVVERHAGLQDVGEERTPGGGDEAPVGGDLLDAAGLALDVGVEAIDAEDDALVDADLALLHREDGLAPVLEDLELFDRTVVGLLEGGEVDPHDDVL